MKRLFKNPDRAMVVDLYKKGIKPKQIFIKTGLNYNTIKYYIADYRKGKV